MDCVSTTTYEGREVLVYDFSRVGTGEEMLARIESAHGVAARHPKKSLLTLTLVAGSYVDADVAQALWRLARENRPYVKASAVVGAEGKTDEVRQLVQHIAGRDLRAFDSVESAKTWLVAQGETGPEDPA